jgi:hypothetical protein
MCLFDRLAPRTVLITVGLALCLTAAALAQFQRFERRGFEPVVRNRPYDGRFALARLKYTTGPGGYYYCGLPAWAHGYADAEQNLMKIVNDISLIAPDVEAQNVFTLDDPNLCRYPVAYMTEAGFWTLTDTEAAAFRAYLLKGAFVIFDDFRDPPRGGGGWENFEANMRRIIPEGHFVEMDPSDPIFHSFFEIGSFDIIPQFYDQARPVFRGLYADNDPQTADRDPISTPTLQTTGNSQRPASGRSTNRTRRTSSA